MTARRTAPHSPDTLCVRSKNLPPFKKRIALAPRLVKVVLGTRGQATEIGMGPLPAGLLPRLSALQGEVRSGAGVQDCPELKGCTEGKEMFRQTYGLAYNDYHRHDLQLGGGGGTEACLDRPHGLSPMDKPRAFATGMALDNDLRQRAGGADGGGSVTSASIVPPVSRMRLRIVISSWILRDTAIASMSTPYFRPAFNISARSLPTEVPLGSTVHLILAVRYITGL
ncbi:hypothetical protein MSAN_00095600 [Mycena sanguinolenta]|uniref:Uncharacterized protein n=1 Tax=Mycena sanguinolenta TaxID=230812 RepID=A0A8H7DLJ1_9AGAR|nr:hypothetical protein MSAN_00095600 [Mycena sanguinolenta]